MKNTMKIVALFFSLAFTSAINAQNYGNDNALIGRATGAAHECFTEGLHNLDINGSVETIGICYVSGDLKRVTLYASPKCHQKPCIMKMMVRVVATVDFDCYGNITSVNCGGNAAM
jgi:hypothetical protein